MIIGVLGLDTGQLCKSFQDANKSAEWNFDCVALSRINQRSETHQKINLTQFDKNHVKYRLYRATICFLKDPYTTPWLSVA